ncbi:MAG: hypothetical protein JST11_05000 [Acidobacteria bacterium]|nr:hypothetical protein [Acidobacteriota bacterium]
MSRSLSVVLLLPWLAPVALAQSLLVPGTAGSTPEVRFETPSGSRPGEVQPAVLEPGVTVLIDSPALDSKGLTNSLSKLLTAGSKGGLQLVALMPSGETRRAHAATRVQLTAAVRSMAAAAGPDATPAVFDAFLQGLRTLSSESWKQVIYLGAEPAAAPQARDYAYALLLRAIGAGHILLFHADPMSAEVPAWAETLRAAGGGISVEGPDQLAVPADAAWFEARLPEWGPRDGFRVLPLKMQVGGAETRSVPWIYGAPGASLPGVPAYADFLARRAAAAKSAGGANEVAALLAINPSDLDTLKLAADAADRAHDTAAIIRYGNRLVELDPGNGANWARLGLAYWKSRDGENAERCLLRARKESADPPQSAAILGDIRAAKRDFASAAQDYREAVTREVDRVELWLKLADAEQRRGRKTEMAQALEEALKRQPDLWPRRTLIMDSYLEAGDTAAAKRHLASGMPLLPADAPLVIRFAGYAERLEMPADAATLWVRAIEVEPANELAHYSLARLYAASRNWDKALAAAERGVEAAPQSARIAGVQADALVTLGRIEDARRALKSTFPRMKDAELLRRAADLEDRYGDDAPTYYRALVEALGSGGNSGDGWRAAAERGLRVSIRESDAATCRWFAQLLKTSGCAADVPAADEATIVLPGGYRAALFMAHGPEESSADAFLADYSRTLNVNAPGRRKGAAVDAYRNRQTEYFHLLADLEAMGKRAAGKTTVRLSLENKATSKLTERVLAMLGWRVRRESGKAVVEPAVKGKRARHQDLASALAIDLVAMQEQVQSGGEFVLEIDDEPVEIFPPEKTWQEQFYKGEHYPGGFAEALVHRPAMAELYAALSNMERTSAALLVQSVGIKPLAEKYATLLGLYSSCLEISAGRVEVPGGSAAAAVWASLVRAQPTDPRRFLRELLDKDDGRLLRFYFLLSQLDMRRQRFFTASAKRTAAFYEVFRDSAQVEQKTSRQMGSSSIEDLFRELPIDAEGHLEFPGAPEVWMVAKGKSGSVASTGRRLRKLSRVTTPEVEDEILLRLIRNEYKDDRIRFGAWQNLLAVMRVDAHHREGLDEESALMLAEKFSSAASLYGYFARLSGLEAKQYREIFTFVEKMRGLEWKQANVAAGLFHSVLYLLTAAENGRRLEPARAASLAGDFVSAMNQAQTNGDRARAALDGLAAYLKAVGADASAPSLREILVTVPADSSFTFGDATYHPGEDLRRSYDRILQVQNVPRLDELLRLHGALLALASGKGDARAAAAAVIGACKGMGDVEVPRGLKLRAAQASLLASSQPARFAALNLRLQKEAARKKLPADIGKAAAEYWEALSFRTVVALAGQVYAANLRADDLLVSEDALFLRKHEFVEVTPGRLDYFPGGRLQVSSEGAGSMAMGGFDGVAAIAGGVGAGSLRNLDANSNAVAAALLGSVRTTNWALLSTRTLRAVAVRIHAAEDWLVNSADDAALYNAVAVSTYGLLSLNRRARLLAGLKHHDWDSVWGTLSLSDRYFLAARMREAAPHTGKATPAIGEYVAGAEMAEGAEALGPALPTLRRYPVPALSELPPYEDTVADPFPEYLAERVAEFKLYLGFLFACQGIEAQGMPALAESAARSVLGDVQMSDFRDWASVMDAYAGFDGSRLREAVGTK